MSHQSTQNSATGHGYPRPQMRRRRWHPLDGTWRFHIDHADAVKSPLKVNFDRDIVVPFAPETPQSGVNDTGFYKACWYRKCFTAPRLKNGERLLLHFGAVDFAATVWVNGQEVVRHEGGYTPFFADITDALNPGEQTIVVRAQDKPHDLEKNRGKQDWLEKEHSIWYPRTTGIWQSVWLEVVPCVSLSSLHWQTNSDDHSVTVTGTISGAVAAGTRVTVKLSLRGEQLADCSFAFSQAEMQLGQFSRRIELVDIAQRFLLPDDPHGDYRNRLYWSPERPNLVDAEVMLTNDKGRAIDKVVSYTAFKRYTTRGRQVLVNDVPEKLRLVLDQGYWRESGMTAPDDAALERDVKLAKEAGFNGVRKHNKLEDPRFLYWADVHGLLVWEELPSAYFFTNKSVERSTRMWTEAIERDKSHPCIMAWVPINESWGVPNLPGSALERQFQRAMYHMTKVLTGGAIVIGNDGWEMVVSDIAAVHDYDGNPDGIRGRYANNAERVQQLFNHERPGGRVLRLEDMSVDDKPILLTEFGGIKLSSEPGSWGYSVADSPDDLRNKYCALLKAVRECELLGGFCYTEFTDVYQEANGLFFMDRSPKFSLEEMRRATRGF